MMKELLESDGLEVVFVFVFDMYVILFGSCMSSVMTDVEKHL